MPQRPASFHPGLGSQLKRDSELCKVVLGAAISQILYARRAFPPRCFQVLPSHQLVSRSFEDIITSGSALQLHDKELLRDQSSTVYLRETRDYAVNRFLGILTGDIFPLLDNEGLVKFRISYLRSKGWTDNSLVEYYTIAFKYEPDGKSSMDIWRAGTGRQHTSTTDSKLWDLGDYLSRLPSWTASMHWTLAFHATERPDDPPIGVWKFDHTDFDNANLSLQQRHEYSYQRITRLDVMPLPPAHVDRVQSETNPKAPHSQPQPNRRPFLNGACAMRTEQRQRSQRTVHKPEARVGRSNGKPHLRDVPTATSARPSPPTTEVIANKKGEASVNSLNRDNRIARGSSEIRKVAPRRKPKQPLPIFDTFGPSPPATQLSGASQPMVQRIQGTHSDFDDVMAIASAPQKTSNTSIRRSFSPSYLLFDGIPLSSEGSPAIIESVPNQALPQLPRAAQNMHQESNEVYAAMGWSERSAGRSRRSSASSASRHAQWVPQASPPQPFLGFLISESQEDNGTVSGAEEEANVAEEALPPPPVARTDECVTYTFSPNTVARRTRLLYDVPISDEDEE